MTREELAKITEIRDGLKNAYWDFTKVEWMAKFDQFIRDTDHALEEAPPSPSDPQQHDWVKSTLGHGERMCRRCHITNREAAILGQLNRCAP